MAKPTCIENGCENPSRTRKLCATHYARLYRATQAKRCTIDGCEGALYAKGLCGHHYTRNRKYGSPLGEAARATVEERLAALSRADGECRTWAGTRNDDGYGRIRVDGRMQSAHRIAWAVARGPLAPGEEIDHICFNRACINVEHLRRADRSRNNAYRLGANSNSATGVRGVHPARREGLFVAQVGGEHIGTFPSVGEAEAAVRAAREERWGPFAGE